MKIIGIICEYNPLHRGHGKQIQFIRSRYPDAAIVCLMSGNFVQRGAPAILDKSLRARAALLAGADLVLELPVTCSLSSAESFAAGGVRILAPFCDFLCFGSETGNAQSLTDTARALLDASFPPLLRAQLDTGKSFPAARESALKEMGMDASLLARPNDILAVEYCKALLVQEVAMKPLPILRDGDYHALDADPENPSATALRERMVSEKDCSPFLPDTVQSIFAGGKLHTLAAGEGAILARLRTMTDAEFESLPYGSEGLWRKFMHACRRCSSLEDIIAATKSKRYTRTRIDRMILCAFLGITKEMLSAPPPYTRILALNDAGRTVLRQAKQFGTFINVGEPVSHPYWELEQRCGALYGLFQVDGIGPPDAEKKQRLYYQGDIS